MNKIAKIMMNRDGMTKDDALAYVRDEMGVVRGYIEEGNYEDAEEYFQDAFGLEPDYLFNALI